MFIGRQRELNKLNKMYKSQKLEVAIIYGRRRIGKTTLINHFCKDKPAIYFMSVENSAKWNLEILSENISSFEAVYEGQSSGKRIFTSFREAFMHIAEMARKERIIFVLDEYPYLAKSEPAISSLLQSFLDHEFKDSKLFLILCGSSMSFMENQVLGYQSPLYGRRTGQFKILPFDYWETASWFPEYSAEEKAVIYGITGGVPLYLEQFNPELDLKENLLNAIFDGNAMLFEEPTNLLKQELREPVTYNMIITAIAYGKSKLSEIATSCGMSTGMCISYINNLISLGIVKKETPLTDPKTHRPIYIIDDMFFRFWYSFVLPNISAITSGRIAQVLDKVVLDKLPDYMGLCFERICRDFILYYDNEAPFPVKEVGQWWGGNPRTKKQAQLDVVANSLIDNSCIIGSCKYRNTTIGNDEFALIKDYAAAMGGFDKYYYYIFSKGGFTEELKNMQGAELRLLSLKDLYLK